MIAFLTSSPTGPLDGSRRVRGLDILNGFADNLRRFWRDDSRNLIISASPTEYAKNDEMTEFFREAVNLSGLSCSSFDLLDRRYDDMSREQILSYDVIWLGGGHVPTQNRFFHEIGLREKLEGYNGIIIGISAGSMNSADVVYVQPEEPGEASDPHFIRYAPGLGITSRMILPHYQMVKDKVLDGMRLFEDITYADSYGKSFLALCDGSYLMIRKDHETAGSRTGHCMEEVYGEAYKIEDGRITRW